MIPDMESHTQYSSNRRGQKLPILLIIAAGLIVYSNSLNGPFISDDIRTIVENHYIRSLWPLWGSTWSWPGGRPTYCFSLAINYALDGLKVWGYHAFNLAIHLCAALGLFGVVRRTLLCEQFGERFQRSAKWLALVIALIWVVHPLQTDSVTYISSRTEPLMGLFYLLTLYCFLRSLQSSQRRVWYFIAVIMCVLGMGSKEVMASAPLMILLYDRTFISGSFRQAWRRHRSLHIGLAATWIFLGAIFIDKGKLAAGSEIGFHFDHLTWLDYLRTQCDVILHYLRLAFWPDVLVVDYFDWPIARTFAEVWPSALFLLAMLGITLWSFWHRSWLCFLGVWFFFILAPSSSICPIPTEIAAERRMYLPLAALIVLVVIAGSQLLENVFARLSLGSSLRRCAAAGVVVAALGALGILTFQRNADYRSQLSIWSDTVAKRPGNSRGQNNLAVSLAEQDRLTEAIQHLNVALAIKPNNHRAHNNLGNALAKQEKNDDAIAHYRRALQINPNYAVAHHNLGLALLKTRQDEEAVEHFSEALRLYPYYTDAHVSLGVAYFHQGKLKEAMSQLLDALEIDPYHLQANLNLADALFQAGSLEEASEFYHQALRFDPNAVRAHLNLGIIMAQQNKTEEAIEQFLLVLQIEPDSFTALTNLGIALVDYDLRDAAVEQLQQALELEPESALAHFHLGQALEELGRLENAIAHYGQAVEIQPDFADAHDCLEVALLKQTQTTQLEGSN